MTHEQFAKITSHIRSYVALSAAIAALVTSVKTSNKPTDTTPARATFETVSGELEKMSAAQAKLYDDLATLQNYIIHERDLEHEHMIAPVTDPKSIASLAAPRSSASPLLGGIEAPSAYTPMGGLYPPGSEPPWLVAPHKHTAPPQLHAKPPAWKAPSFDRVLAAYENVATGAAAVAALQEPAPQPVLVAAAPVLASAAPAAVAAAPAASASVAAPVSAPAAVVPAAP